jgi:ABC-type multidrug transport system ATPase subunit
MVAYNKDEKSPPPENAYNVILSNVQNNKVYPEINSSEQRGFELRWENINMVFEDKKTKENKSILTNVSGSVKSGETLAILGASGAGKTTLLNHLSRKIESQTLKSTGSMLLNNEEINKNDFTSITSYVMQDDVLQPEMTPREILLFTAKLKINAPREVQEKKVAKMLKLLKIEKCQNTKIGDNLNRGVSGGERKRVSIAVELLSDSPIIFLDEPTTGLDSYNAYEVIATINNLAKDTNKIVIFTIHQPASEIFQLLDKICVLALGKTVFFGHKENLEPLFKKIRLPIPHLYNPFEHIIEMTTINSIENSDVLEQYPKLLEIENKQEKYKAYIDSITQIFASDFALEKSSFNQVNDEMRILMHSNKNITGFFYQLFNLVIRQLVVTIRNANILKIHILQNVFIGVILAIVFNNINQDLVGNGDRLGAISFMSIVSVFNAVNALIMTCKLLY